MIWEWANDKFAMIPYAGTLETPAPAGRDIGYYFNIQYTGVGSHLVQGQSPRKLERNLRLIEATVPGHLSDVMLNVGNVREFGPTIAAASALEWNFADFDAARWQQQFCARYFGAQNAQNISRLYDELFAAYWEVRAPQAYAPIEQQYVFQDLKIARFTDSALKMLESGQYQPDPIASTYWGGKLDPAYRDRGAGQMDAIVAGNQEMFPRLEALVRDCDAHYAALQGPGREFFNQNLRLQAHFLLDSNRFLNALILAAKELPDQTRVMPQLQIAAPLGQAAARDLDEMDTGRFADWHQAVGRNGFPAREYSDRVQKLLAPRN